MYSILIVEDDPAFRSMIETILQMEGFETRSAPEAATALALVICRRPDLILCDMMLPGQDGQALLQAVRSDASLAHIPFIFITALEKMGETRSGMSTGADDYLTAPFSAEELLAAVNGQIRGRGEIGN